MIYYLLYMSEDNNYMIGTHNLNNISLIPKGKNLLIRESTKEGNIPITFKLYHVNAPFGIEKYAYKELINFEITGKDKYNNAYNNYAKIKQIDEFFKNEDNYVKHFDPENMQYRSCLREKDNYDPMVRIHLKKRNRDIQTVFTRKDKIIHPSDIKGKVCNIEVELGDIWHTQYHYGLVLYVTKVELA